MSYPAYTQQPYPQSHPGYNPQGYPAYPQPTYPPPPGQYGPYPQPQPQIIYQDGPHHSSRLNDPNTCWLLSLLALCCGCFVGQECCDSNVCCCLIPCALPRFR